MKKSVPVASKKRGRPPTGGRDPGVHVRLPELMLEIIDARSVKEGTSRSEAIRRLVEIGLGSVKVARAQKRSDSPTARDLAAVQIDRLTDPLAPADEPAQRKRRLLKGPEEFREARVDRVKKK
jgi:hypothetical protein